MASENRPPTNNIVEELEAAPFSFGFYQAMRMLEATHTDLPRLGKSRRVQDDPVRIAQQPSLAFAPSTIASFDAKRPGAPRLEQFFLGLLGPNGPMPTHITEYVIDRQVGHKDPTLARFLDIFHHRAGLLFYRIWADAEPAADLNRQDDWHFSRFVASLIGLGQDTMRERDALSDSAKMFLAGRFSSNNKNPEGLLAILTHLFEMPVAMEEFYGQWLTLPPSGCCRLGSDRSTGSLGQNAVIGTQIYDRQSNFFLEFGPLDLPQFESLLPSSSRISRLIAAVRNYLGDEYGWGYRMTLKSDQVPELRLGQTGQLGWTSWLNKPNRSEDSRDFQHVPNY